MFTAFGEVEGPVPSHAPSQVDGPAPSPVEKSSLESDAPRRRCQHRPCSTPLPTRWRRSLAPRRLPSGRVVAVTAGVHDVFATCAGPVEGPVAGAAGAWSERSRGPDRLAVGTCRECGRAEVSAQVRTTLSQPPSAHTFPAALPPSSVCALPQMTSLRRAALTRSSPPLCGGCPDRVRSTASIVCRVLSHEAGHDRLRERHRAARENRPCVAVIKSRDSR